MNSPDSKKHHVYPASMAVFLDSGLRKLSQDPARILEGLIRKGDAAADIGCGPGFFTLKMAEMAGEAGKVYACDIQEKMLDMARKKAEKCGIKNIFIIKSAGNGTGIKDKLDFALCFGVAHEMPDAAAFFRELSCLMKKGGRVLFVEPKSRVSADEFKKSIGTAVSAGFSACEKKDVSHSRAVVMEKQI